MLREIAKLLNTGQRNARIKVEHINIEENMMAAQEIIELFCELIVVDETHGNSKAHLISSEEPSSVVLGHLECPYWLLDLMITNLNYIR
ncbi:hypothetical protein PIB30_073269 [Stylosanthes scabra]|uniref:Uncharacterized protein n=1 Tax=Stylosanthes scabra TaxID=79078 RepID=A0ABU6VRV8_9FABA|nr:hypothetical protein [Stylosanthes scabra]